MSQPFVGCRMKRAVFRLPFPKTRQSSSHKPTRARLSRYSSTHLYFIASKLHASYARLALRRRRLLNFFHLHRRPSPLGACNCSQREGFCVVVFWCVEGYVVLAGCFGSCLVVGPAAVRRSTCWHAGANGWMLGEEGRRGRKSRIARLPVSGARFETEHLTSSRSFVVAQTMAAKSLRARPNSSWTERRNNTRRKGAAHQTRTRGACWRLKYNGSVNCASANVVFFTHGIGFECLR